MEGAKRHGKVLQCGCIKEDTKPILSGFAHQGGINGVLNQGPCAFIRACIADAKAELEAEEKEKVFIKTCRIDAKRKSGKKLKTPNFKLNRQNTLF